jgi:hypothetical protein
LAVIVFFILTEEEMRRRDRERGERKEDISEGSILRATSVRAEIPTYT